MRYFALATDYDGTLAHHGVVAPETIQALERLRASGRRLILVTGRQLEDLFKTFPEYSIFDRIVAENGALLYTPEGHKEITLGEPPPPEFARRLRKAGVEDVAEGRVIVATWTPHESAALELIREMGLEHQVIFNKGAVMILPAGINKATGLAAALDSLGLSPHNVAGVGDAENDHALLRVCECSVAVANALPSIKDRVHFVTRAPHGEGIIELIEMMLADDLAALDGRLLEHSISIGIAGDETEVRIHPGRESLLVGGASGAGKSTFTNGFMERLAAAGYQYCLVDPEGDYEESQDAITVGDAKHPPVLDEVVALLQKPNQNASVNMVGLPLDERPGFFEPLFLRLKELRARTGRPHWILLDESQHMIPRDRDSAGAILPQAMQGVFMITLKPSGLAQPVLLALDVLVAIGQGAEEVLADFARALGRPAPKLDFPPVDRGEGIVWFRHTARPPFKIRIIPPQTHYRRHQRKYIEGEMEEVSHFFFRGPEGKLNLRAQNLKIFLQLAEGVDDDTWMHHLRQGDYTQWFLEVVKDPELAKEAEPVEKDETLTPAQSREAIKKIIERRYTAP